MKITRPPTKWLALYPGESIISRAPLHRIERYIEAMRDRGYELTTEPHDFGYLVTCVKRPIEAAA